ncbi:uncharacterized protein LOC123522850 [Mercenaria mercenaria]|uniref:uncharacterized protein LOC123522850 n=1 Tax=Mercenaria mercenaria TaxID=6596 RepID=UPI00234EDA19|nr:uncharacterized protein LOC123522850 [Mercenaria mercenaria]XP_053405534.1 uncharacterized protein LOC123522850 [Mercenaria mercenaria]XP_053405535.1 uncharacterized protein LOC123522850 [Mercenaria mercenaria]XP_053405536.1 uncharacterized protein LOC123522850 [Mercenaria mercenaria]
MSDPEEITIVVHSAKGIKGKKPGRHKFSVIFGLGGTKFRTAVVKDPDGNPDWNEETVVHVSNVLDQVFFIITEKDDILGQISIPVTSLKALKGQAKHMPLQPHKKCPSPQGELVYQCYVSKYRPPGDHLPIIKGVTQTPQDVQPRSAFQRLRKRMASPVTQRRNKKDDKKDTKSGSLANFNKKFSRSIQDLFSFSKFSASESINVDDNDSISSKSSQKKDKNKRRFSLSFLSVSNDLDKAGDDPLITSCTPNSGPIDQPTRLAIEGRNLGVGKSDILSLKIAGCDCTDTIEFESSSRIYCTTHFWKVCKGAVIIDTISGGIGTLKDGFCFYEELDANENSSTNPFENDMDEKKDQLGSGQNEQIDFSIGGKEIKSGSNTVPRIRNSAIVATSTPNRSPAASTPVSQGRYQKKHTKSASETKALAVSQPPVEHVSKEELQSKIVQLEEENAALKKDNTEMKSYIDKLVAKCMLHCPEALAQEDDEKTKLFVL